MDENCPQNNRSTATLFPAPPSSNAAQVRVLAPAPPPSPKPKLLVKPVEVFSLPSLGQGPALVFDLARLLPVLHPLLCWLGPTERIPVPLFDHLSEPPHRLRDRLPVPNLDFRAHGRASSTADAVPAETSWSRWQAEPVQGVITKGVPGPLQLTYPFARGRLRLRRFSAKARGADKAAQGSNRQNLSCSGGGEPCATRVGLLCRKSFRGRRAEQRNKPQHLRSRLFNTTRRKPFTGQSFSACGSPPASLLT